MELPRPCGPRGATLVLWVAAVLAAASLNCACLAPVYIVGKYTQASSQDETRRWPEDLSGASPTADLLPVYELAERLSGAVQDRCVSRQDLEKLAGGGAAPTQVRIESIRATSGVPGTNWVLLPYNLISAVSLGIVPMVFLEESELSATARLEGPGGESAPVTVTSSDRKAQWIFVPLALGPQFTLIDRRWESPAFTRNLETEVSADLLDALARAALQPGNGVSPGRGPAQPEPVRIPCFLHRGRAATSKP